MIVCWCSLAGTKACLNCSNNQYNNQIENFNINPIYNPSPVKKITEIYDENGKLKQRIIENE